MGSVALVSFAGSWFGFDYMEDILISMGHTMTVVIDTAVSATNLSAYDLIIVSFTTVDQATLTSHLDNHMDTFGIPVFVTPDFHGSEGLTDDNYVTSSGKVLSRLGMTASCYRNRYAGGVDEAGYGFNVPQTQFNDHEISIYKSAYGTPQSMVANGFQQPTDDWEGESFIWGNPPTGGTGDIAVAQPGLGQVAGSPLCRLSSSYWGDHREVCGTIIEAGDARVGQRTGTFSTNMAWMGMGVGSVLTGNTAQLFETIVRWCLVEYATLEYSGGTYTAVCRYPGIDFSDIEGTTLGSATMSWDSYWAPASAALYYVSWDGGPSGWAAMSTPGAINGASIGAPLAGMRLSIKAAYVTFGAIPPDSSWLANLKVTWTSEQAPLTATDKYFQEGHLLWTSGANEGQSMEVKEYDDSTKAMKLFLKMREPLAAGDTFTVLPGCDKKKATCIAKFANIINFQGEPDIPGEDQTLKTVETK